MWPTAFALGPLLGLQVRSAFGDTAMWFSVAIIGASRSRSTPSPRDSRGGAPTLLTPRPVTPRTPNDARTALSALRTLRAGAPLSRSRRRAASSCESRRSSHRPLDGANFQGHRVTSFPARRLRTRTSASCRFRPPKQMGQSLRRGTRERELPRCERVEREQPAGGGRPDARLGSGGSRSPASAATSCGCATLTAVGRPRAPRVEALGPEASVLVERRGSRHTEAARRRGIPEGPDAPGRAVVAADHVRHARRHADARDERCDGVEARLVGAAGDDVDVPATSTARSSSCSTRRSTPA